MNTSRLSGAGPFLGTSMNFRTEWVYRQLKLNLIMTHPNDEPRVSQGGRIQARNLRDLEPYAVVVRVPVLGEGTRNHETKNDSVLVRWG